MMIQTDTCAICRGGIYRDVTAPWDDDKWLHMNPESNPDSVHIPAPKIRSTEDDDAAE